MIQLQDKLAHELTLLPVLLSLPMSDFGIAG
jgi:hypothetical protein